MNECSNVSFSVENAETYLVEIIINLETGTALRYIDLKSQDRENFD